MFGSIQRRWVSAVWNRKGYILKYKGDLSKTAKRPRSTKYQLFDENRCPNQSDALAHKEKFVNELEKELGSKRAYESPVAAPPPTEPVATADVRHTRDPKRQKLMQKKEAKRKEAADKRHASYVAERKERKERMDLLYAVWKGRRPAYTPWARTCTRWGGGSRFFFGSHF